MSGYAGRLTRPTQSRLRQGKRLHRPMSFITITTKLHEPRPAQAQLRLPFELRSKSRLRTSLTNGETVGLFLERGTVLRSGDLLLAEDGRVIEVIAAPETV